ncbi:MAG: endonuclease/exonuclease/phosphatase family protein [Chitinispirillales bacterium]|jgi:endonuclease/exonuclease/phosphatase family metal-dependent hydrolase|nr:endonuclease/exonuclease/phosphatase family protein [Chitinispirillales bacterium]
MGNWWKQPIILVCVCILCISPAVAQKKNELRVATYNIRYDTPKDSLNAWSHRKDNVKALIMYHNFDIVGTQEALARQLKDLGEMLEYAYFDGGQNDGLSIGGHVSIFFKRDRFKQLDSGVFWLNETPNKRGKGWDATNRNRACLWVKFHDVNTEKIFFLFNVHFDYDGVIARTESAKLMVQKIKEIAGKVPVICTGDFNAIPKHEPIQIMQTILNDAYAVTIMPPYGPVGTYNGFKFDASLKGRIDYIFVSDHFSVLKYATLTDSKNQRYPSDHLPVVVDLLLE